MFCPKCGNLLVLKHFVEYDSDELYCEKGDMLLSKWMQQKLEQRYGPNATPQSPNPPFNKQFHEGLYWFCPGDGEKLNEQLECSKCGKHLRDLVYPLVEVHSHEGSETSEQVV